MDLRIYLENIERNRKMWSPPSGVPVISGVKTVRSCMSYVVLVKRDFKRIKGVTGLLGSNWPLETYWPFANLVVFNIINLRKHFWTATSPLEVVHHKGRDTSSLNLWQVVLDTFVEFNNCCP